MTVQDLVISGLHKFQAMFPAFTFRFAFAPSLSLMHRMMLEGSDAPVPLDTLVTDLEKKKNPAPRKSSRARLAGSTLVFNMQHRRHHRWIPNKDFQFGQIMLVPPAELHQKILNEPDPDDPAQKLLEVPSCTFSYYMREHDWLERAALGHADGSCGWSRYRQVWELEKELAHDIYDETLTTNDDAWALRRPKYVELYQAIFALRDTDDAILKPRISPEDGNPGQSISQACKQSPSFCDVVGTCINLPRGRENDEYLIQAEARPFVSKPLHLYGCPYAMELNNVCWFLLLFLQEAGVISESDSLITSPTSIIGSEHVLNISTTPTECSDSQPEFHINRFLAGLLSSSDTNGLWDLGSKVLPEHGPPVTCCDFRNADGSSNGVVFIFNPFSDVAGQLPTMTREERVFPVPGTFHFDTGNTRSDEEG
eukprot:CAMPEP_0185753238 /NCGR_PEP_ID=MMETSP1174-20130828/11962_1 /TAXON_ID=35687 /ORGANISM="Dictyocha speculum, Strain CCMP1381" /LENGTH=423 /DNA_ID=CAMNT_0028430983 /DNA_START=150 /DNA_END=1421 /DNA_ORIENTATION=+